MPAQQTRAASRRAMNRPSPSALSRRPQTFPEFPAAATSPHRQIECRHANRGRTPGSRRHALQTPRGHPESARPADTALQPVVPMLRYGSCSSSLSARRRGDHLIRLAICAKRCRIPDALYVFNLELLLRPVEQNPQVLPLDAELAAHLVAVALFQKHSLEQRTVARSQLQQNLAYLLPNLLRCRHVEGIRALGGRLGLAFFIQ